MNAEPETATQRIAAALREQIRGMRVGQRLPSRAALARDFGVAPSTVQKALAELQQEGLIETGRGARAVVADQQGLPAREILDGLLETALLEPELRIDYFGFTAETLAKVLVPILREAEERAAVPDVVRLRLLLPSAEAKLALPYAMADRDDPRPRERFHAILRTQIAALGTQFDELRVRRPAARLSLDVRYIPLTPTHKFYLINDREAWQGLYKVISATVPLPTPGGGSEDALIRDVVGMNAPLVSYDYEIAREWFDSYWSGPALDRTLGA
jgi:DNA-binding transcriptional regulator YhcF (GntR family)